MSTVAFDVGLFFAQFPALAESVAPIVAEQQWQVAGIYLRNDAGSHVQDVTKRALLLNMLTAHLCILNSPDRFALVGRISGATEGSVSVQAAMDAAPGTAAWFNQTPPGAQFWAATAYLRTNRYVPAPRGRMPW